MSVKEIRQLRTQIMMTALALGIRNDQTLLKSVDSIPPAPLAGEFFCGPSALRRPGFTDYKGTR
jgi:hypothetical protein